MIEKPRIHSNLTIWVLNVCVFVFCMLKNIRLLSFLKNKSLGRRDKSFKNNWKKEEDNFYIEMVTTVMDTFGARMWQSYDKDPKTAHNLDIFK